MNLRQKVKKAKKQLPILKEQPTTTQWDMVQNYMAQRKLQELIDFKRKPTRHYHWNETPEIDWKKLTYIEITADWKSLAVLKSPNGKPLHPAVIDQFVNLIIGTKFYNYAKKISESEWITLEKPAMRGYEERHNTVEYAFVVSSDCTKQKRLHYRVFYYQLRGSDKLYKPQKEGN